MIPHPIIGRANRLTGCPSSVEKYILPDHYVMVSVGADGPKIDPDIAMEGQLPIATEDSQITNNTLGTEHSAYPAPPEGQDTQTEN